MDMVLLTFSSIPTLRVSTPTISAICWSPAAQIAGVGETWPVYPVPTCVRVNRRRDSRRTSSLPCPHVREGEPTGRESKVLGKPLTPKEVEHFTDTVRHIAAILMLTGE